MAPRSFLLCGVISLMASPAVAQFGVAGGKKRGTSFQDLAKEFEEGFDLNTDGMFDNLLKEFGGYDEGGMADMVDRAMKDPQMQQLMKDLDIGEVQSVMDELSKLTPEKLAAQMEEAMNMMTSDDYLETAMKNKDQVLDQLEASGLISDEDLQAFRDDPEKLKTTMQDAMSQMMDVFTNPGKLEEAQKEINEGLSQMFEGLSDSDKIEEARLQLLSNPDLIKDSGLGDLFGTDEMKALLQDPEKWKQNVEEGKKMMLQGSGLGFGQNEIKAEL